MELTEKELNLLCEAIYKVYPCSEQLEEILNQNEDLNEKLILKIDSSNLLDDDSLCTLNKYNQNNSENENEKVKLLILEAYNTNFINYKNEYNEIMYSIKSNNSIIFDINKDKVVVKETQEFHDATLSREYQICHFLGHGNNGVILSSEEITPEKLKSYFQYRSKCKCVIFNACSSEEAAKQVSEHIDYAIGMTQVINDEVAIKFAGGFYRGLQNGIDNNQEIFLTGFREGIVAIKGDKNSQENIPVLYINYKQAILSLLKQLDYKGKIEDFIKILCGAFPNNKIFRIYSYPVKKADLNNFINIINGINQDNIWRSVLTAYRETLPKDAIVDNSDLNNPLEINDIIDILCEQYPYSLHEENIYKDIPSILEFAKNLASKFLENSEGYQIIQRWVEEVSSKLSIKVDVNPKIESKSTLEQQTFLSIFVSPEGSKFRLEAEYVLDDNQNLQPQPFDFQDRESNNYKADKGFICSEKEIPSVLDKIINNFMSSFREEMVKPTIEIFLPYKYLGKNLDNEWRIKDDFKDEIAIVQEYKIIFYPLERFTGNNSYSSFKEVWLIFEDILRSDADINSIITHVETIQKIDKNYRKLAKHLKLKRKIGVKLMSHFPVKEKEQEYFWRTILSGGIPLVFWTRYHRKDNINLDDIDIYLTKKYLENNFANFIFQMCKIRQDAYDDEDNQEDKLGYHLGFLCDNLNRIKKSKLLKSFL
ncbi:VMAP-C domain-containing protein [Mastigocoleus testarum]|uniref:vWA-MoxR associated protein C-terminal domain-containing protein n=1 Tax=Mastigocoleus testarum BC008 TaxID=371196 RepID=A0A0V7ZM74_9CYAN|nr:hypothetical protein [Mastigocoleus testarum]KST65474.1 hypothetical protein BC008_41835 [Mastigocoleus testarum BC008]